jgi:dolichol-phosphate mannosyltransferase
LTELAARDPRVRLIRLSRNFGQHAAITAGLSTARGRWTVVMDCDLQDPPEQIPRLYAKAQEGFDIVYARRTGRKHSWFRRTASSTYFRLLNLVSHTELTAEFGNFSIISEKVREAFLAFRDKDRHFLMILKWLGFEHSAIEFQHAERFAGESSYTLGMLIRFALAGLFFQTTTLLRWIVYAGFGISVAGAGLAVFFVVNYFLGNPYPGWTSLGVLLLLIGGFIIVSTGVTGLYIGKIFTQVKDRPLFVVDTTVNAEVQQPEALHLHEATGEAPPRRTAF